MMARGIIRRYACGLVALFVAVCPLWTGAAAAEKAVEEPIPRILLVGDSWPMFLSTGLFFWYYDNGSAFRDILPQMGYGRWGDLGDRTALGGSMITEWSTNEVRYAPPYGWIGLLDLIQRELTEYPTLDIVHLCLGGNDYMRGDFSAFIDYIPFQMQTLSFAGDPTGGTFTLTFDGATTSPIPYGADAAVVDAALEALGTIGAGNVEVTPTSGMPTYFCWFQGVFEDTPVPMMTANGSGLTGDGDEAIAVHGVEFDHGWKETWGAESPAELAFAQAILEQMQIVVETALDARPDVRVLVCDYDYMDEDVGGATVLESNTALTKGGLIKLELASALCAKPEYANRCFFHNTYGLMQWWFGYPCEFELVGTPPVAYRVQTTLPEDQIYGPQGASGTGGTIELPGTFPDYEPWAGGDLNHPGPAMAILYDFGKDARAPAWAKAAKGANIHLHKQGNHVYARYCVEKFYGEWLDQPRVLAVSRATCNPIVPGEILETVGFPEVAFEVVFSEPVTGVDAVDFQPVVGGGLANASVKDVSEGKQGDTYVVTVDTGSGDGTLGLAVVDNDSVVDLDNGYPLAGDVDGSFAGGEAYQIDRSVAGLPVAALPVALALAGAGALALRRRVGRPSRASASR